MSAFVTYEFIGIYFSLSPLHLFFRKASDTFHQIHLRFCLILFHFVVSFHFDLSFFLLSFRCCLSFKLICFENEMASYWFQLIFFQSNWKITLHLFFLLQTSNRIDSRKLGMRIISVDVNSKQKCVSFVTHIHTDTQKHTHTHLFYLLSE